MGALAATWLLIAAAAHAAEHDAGALVPIGHFELGQAARFRPNTLLDAADYSNITNFLGGGVLQGGTANQAGNQITRLLADDLLPNGANAGGAVTQITFSVANFNNRSVTVRPRVRFWFDDIGAPGAYYNLPAEVGFTFDPFTFTPGVTLLTALVGPGQFAMPGGVIWAGVTFDDFNGTTGAPVSLMNNLGQGMFGPPDVGFSSIYAFMTETAGSFFGVSHPAGSVFDLGGGPPATFGWELRVMEPVPTVRRSWGRIKNAYR